MKRKQNKQRLKDKVVVITGASDGLGKAIALELAKKGTELALVARNKNKLQKLQRQISSCSLKCKYYICDVTDTQMTEETNRKILSDFGVVNILVNNAGIYFEGSAVDLEVSQTKDLFATNTLGVIFFTKAILPEMLKRNSGQIFNVISVAGLEPSDKWGIYAATKYAVRGFTESLRMELRGTKIKVLAFYPDGMDTNIFKAAGLSIRRNYTWMMKKEEIAKIISFMLSLPRDIVMNHVEVRKI